jgi:hypothetical protein
MPREYGISNAVPYSTAPAVGVAGDMYYDSTTKALYISDGTAWIICVGVTNLTANELAIFAVTTTKIANNAVTNVKLAQSPTLSLKGNITGATANVADVTLASVTPLLGPYPLIFASAAARDAAITAPSEGMTCYLQDRDIYTNYMGSAWVDLIQAGPWDLTYTPTLTQTATVTKTVSAARYTRNGKTIDGVISLAVTGPGTSNGNIIMSLPVAARATTPSTIGHGWIYDTSLNGLIWGHALLTSTTTFGIKASASAAFVGNGTISGGLASGDSIEVMFHYEAA